MVKILFCGQHFRAGYEFTREAVAFHFQLKKALIDNDICPVDVLICSAEEVPTKILDATIVIPFMTKITSEIMDLSPNLRLVMQFGVGLEGVDISAASKRGIAVCSLPSEPCGNAASCAEHCIFLAIAILRDWNGLQNSIKENRLGWPLGRTLFNSTVAIVGCGGIAQQLLPRLVGMGVHKVHFIVRDELKCRNALSKLPCFEFTNIEILNIDNFGASTIENHKPIITASVLFLCCSQNKTNYGFVNSSFLSYFSSGLGIVNVSRGGLFNYCDLREALDTRHVSGVGLDVFHTEPFPLDDPLLNHPQVILTPHIAGVTEISYRNMAQLVTENAFNLLLGKELIGNIVV